MRSLAHRIRKKIKKKGQSDDSLNVSDQLQHNTPKRFKGILVPKPSGLLGLNEEDWKELSKDKKKFVQDYNAKVKHGEDTKHLPVPPGLKIKIKLRPRRRQDLDDDLVEEKKDDPDQPPKKKTKKSISFPLESE